MRSFAIVAVQNSGSCFGKVAGKCLTLGLQLAQSSHGLCEKYG